jgi:arsenate reductase-like glutaredoxin family protein
MWCRSHPSEWSSLDRCFPAWTVEELKTHKDRIVAERLKEPRDICGVVSYPVWDFIEPLHYLFPELHVEIGLVNNVLDKFYDWVEDHIEVASAEEKLCCNTMIILDTELTKAANKLERWKTLHGTELTESWNRLSDVQTALQSRRTSPQERQLLDQQQQQLNATISLLADAKKLLESDVTVKQKAFRITKKN